MESDDGACGHDDAHSLCGECDELWVVGEEARDVVWDYFGDEEGEEHDGGGTCDGVPEGGSYSGVLLCSVVVSDDGLHSLVESHDEHGEEHHDAVDDAVGSYCEVASMGVEGFVDDDDDEACAGVEYEWCHSDGYDAFDDAGV